MPLSLLLFWSLPEALSNKLQVSVLTLMTPKENTAHRLHLPGRYIFCEAYSELLSAALSQHHLSGFEIAQLEFHHLH